MTATRLDGLARASRAAIEVYASATDALEGFMPDATTAAAFWVENFEDDAALLDTLTADERSDVLRRFRAEWQRIERRESPLYREVGA